MEAAEILGITPDAVRSRLRRGTLERSTERGDDGEVLVVLRTVGDKSGRSNDQSNGASSDTSRGRSETVAGEADQSELVEALRDQITLLTRQLDEANRANSEHRRLLAAALERIPELEASREGPLDLHGGERGDHETAAEHIAGPGARDAPESSQQPAQRRSWLYRFFFGPG